MQLSGVSQLAGRAATCVNSHCTGKHVHYTHKVMRQICMRVTLLSTCTAGDPPSHSAGLLAYVLVILTDSLQWHSN
jgi:hypothetical protein